MLKNKSTNLDFDFSQPENLDELVNFFSESNEKDVVIDCINQQTKVDSVVKLLSIRKNVLFEECDLIHQEIKNLQHHSRRRQEKVKKYQQTLVFLHNYLRENTKFEDDISTFDDSQKNSSILDERKKRRKERNFIFKEKTPEEIRIYKEKLKKEVKKYQNINYDKLEQVKILRTGINNDFVYMAQMTKDIVKKKYDNTSKEQVKRFHQEIVFLRYLEKCQMVPRLLHFVPDQCIIYLPYHGDIAEDSQANKKYFSLMCRKLKNNWGVYRIKDDKVLNSVPINNCCYDQKNNEGYFYDFGSPCWNIDRSKPYKMKN